ncbi:uncharacterized protein LOC141695615 [Apium graveolens]|uniref:uncharacterized protein LOC141695615 n=1 Tax=Apium graveolens TaxID=4045 RepID=UPI003D79E191
MSLALSAKNKLGLVTGKFKAPDVTSDYFDHWQRCNDMIITWILNSLSPEIRSSLVYVSLAVDVWTNLHTRFAHNNGPHIFELKRAISDLTQETLSISAYYTKFKQLTDDLNNVAQVPKYVCACTCKAKADIDQHEEVMKVTQFLMGLNENYTNIIAQLLMMSPMPRITQLIPLDSQIGLTNLMLILSDLTLAPSMVLEDLSKKGNLECMYCHGADQSDASDSDQTISLTNALSTSQYHQLLVMLNQASTSSTTANVNDVTIIADPPQSGTCSYMPSICLVNCHSINDWILDSGATDHITCNVNYLIIIKPCSVNLCLPSGKFSLVTQKGTVNLASTIILQDVLLIPEFHFNLISISKLMLQLTLEVHFLPTQCLIQDPMTKKVMGTGNLQGNLYKFALHQSHNNSPSSTFSQSQSSFFQVSTVLKHIEGVSSQLCNNNLSPCDVCHFAKQGRLPFNFHTTVKTVFEPTHYEQAIQDPLWCQAMQTEVNALEANNTWEFTDLPPGKKVVACKWLYKVKYKADGTLDRYKARLVAKGFTQTSGVDYFQTYAPVAKYLLLGLYYHWLLLKNGICINWTSLMHFCMVPYLQTYQVPLWTQTSSSRMVL